MTGNSYTLRQSYKNETEEIVSLIAENFWTNNPVFERYASVLRKRCPGGVEEFIDNRPHLARYKVVGLTQSLIAVHNQSSKIVGHIGLSVYERDSENNAKSDGSSKTTAALKSKIVTEYQSYLGSLTRKSDIYEKFPKAKKFVNLGVLTVDSNHRGSRLSERLLREALKWAETNKIQVAHGTFASSYSQRPADKIGFKTLKEYDIRDFRDSNGIQVFADATPNEPFVIKAIALSEFSI